MFTSLRSKKQQQNRGQRRLDKSLEAIAQHECWQSGLGISCSMAALRPELLQAVDHEQAVQNLKDGFSYDKEPVPNSIDVGPLFRSCMELHPGVCRSDALYDFAIHLSMQLKAHLDILCLPTLTLFQLQTYFPTPTTGPESLPPIPNTVNWYLLGNIRKRPLCYIFAKYIPLSGVVGARRQAQLIPEVDAESKCFTLLTSYEILLACLKLAQGSAESEAWKNVKIRMSSHKYQLVASSDIPNHLLRDIEENVFHMGPNLEIPKPEPKSRKETENKLRFGLDFMMKPKKGKNRGCKRKREERESETKPLDNLTLPLDPFADAPDRPDGADANGNAPGDAPGADDDYDNDLKVDREEECSVDAFPAQLNLIQFKELKKAIKAGKDAEGDAAAVEEEDEIAGRARKSRAKSRPSSSAMPSTASNSGANEARSSREEKPDATAAASASDRESCASLARKGTVFNQRLGIVAFNLVQRRSSCFVCKQQLVKADLRFQISLALNKPEKSVHPECVAQIPANLLAPSIEWIESRLKDSEHLKEFESKTLKESGQRLRCMLDCC